MVDYVVFVVQKVLLRLVLPVSSGLLIALTGLLLWRRHRRGSFVLLLFAWVWLLVLSTPLVGLQLVRTLESKAGTYVQPSDLAARQVRYIVMLSGGFRQGALTPADRLGVSVLRVMEAVRLWREMRASRVVLTGGVVPGLSEGMSLAQAEKEMIVELGVPDDAVILEATSWTTEDQADEVSPIVGKEPFALVTSAFHMHRSLVIFRAKGLKPIPAPTDFLAKIIPVNYETCIPQASGLVLSQIAAKEYLATVWFQIRNLFLRHGRAQTGGVS